MAVRTYGVTKNIRSEIKLQGSITLNDLAVFVVVGMVAAVGGFVFPPTEETTKMIFYGVMVVLALWLDMKPVSNPGKRNYQIMLFMLQRQQTHFKSLNQNYDEKAISYMKHATAGQMHTIRKNER